VFFSLSVRGTHLEIHRGCRLAWSVSILLSPFFSCFWFIRPLKSHALLPSARSYALFDSFRYGVSPIPLRHLVSPQSSVFPPPLPFGRPRGSDWVNCFLRTPILMFACPSPRFFSSSACLTRSLIRRSCCVFSSLSMAVGSIL